MYSYIFQLNSNTFEITITQGDANELTRILKNVEGLKRNIIKNSEGLFSYSSENTYDPESDIIDAAHKVVSMLSAFGWTRVFPEADSSGTTVRD
jgi:hypothetical protein